MQLIWAEGNIPSDILCINYHFDVKNSNFVYETRVFEEDSDVFLFQMRGILKFINVSQWFKALCHQTTTTSVQMVPSTAAERPYDGSATTGSEAVKFV